MVAGCGQPRGDEADRDGSAGDEDERGGERGDERGGERAERGEPGGESCAEGCVRKKAAAECACAPRHALPHWAPLLGVVVAKGFRSVYQQLVIQ